MRRKRAGLRRRYGSGGQRVMWRVWHHGKDVGVVMAADHGEAMRKAKRALGADSGIEVEAVS